jgi:DNA-3-methyladenine glycosylase I
MSGHMKQRCAWCGTDPLYVAYHDDEWGVPVHDDRKLFEMLILEGAQAGLSWLTILKKRDNYRRALHGFDAARIARYTNKDVARLLAEPGIRNARGVLAVQEEFGTLDTFLWRYVDGVARQNAWPSRAELPARSVESDRMGKDLKKRGFGFVGSTICYAFMQAVGMVNDHTVDCFRYAAVRRLGRSSG